MKALIEFDRELKQSAPGFVRQTMVERCESHVGYVVSFEILLSHCVPYEDVEKDPRATASKLWEKLQAQLKDGFGDDVP